MSVRTIALRASATANTDGHTHQHPVPTTTVLGGRPAPCRLTRSSLARRPGCRSGGEPLAVSNSFAHGPTRTHAVAAPSFPHGPQPCPRLTDGGEVQNVCNRGEVERRGKENVGHPSTCLEKGTPPPIRRQSPQLWRGAADSVSDPVPPLVASGPASPSGTAIPHSGATASAAWSVAGTRSGGPAGARDSPTAAATRAATGGSVRRRRHDHPRRRRAAPPPARRRLRRAAAPRARTRRAVRPTPTSRRPVRPSSRDPPCPR